MSSYNKRKTIARLVLLMIINIIIIIGIRQIGMMGNETMLKIGGAVIMVSSLNGVLTSLLNLNCVLMECIDYKKGSVLAVISLSIQIVMSMIAIVMGHTLAPLPGIVNMIIMLIVTVVLQRYFSRREIEITTDELTGLLNRKGLLKQFDIIDDNDKFYLIYVDIDDFKLINDNLGHKCGDRVIVIIANRLREVVGKKTIISRISGDEFVVLLPAENDIEKTAQNILNAISEKIMVNSENNSAECYITASIGIASFPKDSSDFSALMKYSDIAMYEAKKQGKNKYLLFNSSLAEALERQAELEKIIKQSLSGDYFYLVYQPQYETEGKALRGFETLLRLRTADGTFVSPGEFIPAAEKTDLILQIDEYVIDRAMREFTNVVRSVNNKITLSINVSAKNICSYGFADMVKEAAERHSFPCECLEIEITEYCLAKSLDIAIENITKLKALGVEIALDDFGTGYASLSYLSKLSIDLLKIDKSFIDQIGVTPRNNDFISAVISIGHLHDCKVISEGVETEEQLSLLREKGCDYIQGFIWGKPLPFSEAVELAESYYSVHA